ncbi:MAG TPA: hypothetical protein VKJ65_12955, partial [Phycisphaerae bacterium]|nr:hypothetical protein [Phycisphaerae bacterium]
DMQQALSDLSSDRYETRQKAQQELQQAMGEQFAAMVGAAGTALPEQQTRLQELLTMNANLSRWAMAVLTLPPQQREAMFEWGLEPAILPLASGAFSPDPMMRASVVHAIGKLSDSNSDWLLETLLKDPERVVYLSAMDAVWDRKPTDQMVHILWEKAVGNGTFSPPAVAPIYVDFRDQKIQIQEFVYYWDMVSDGGYAEQVLEHWNPPLLSSLLVDFTHHLANHPSIASNFFAGPGMILARNYAQLLSLTKPPDVAEYLLNLVGTPVNNAVNLQFNGRAVHWDDHTIILYLLVMLSGQDPGKYHFYRSPLYGGTWLVETQAQEDADIKAICAWWLQHGVTAATPDASSPANVVTPSGILSN